LPDEKTARPIELSIAERGVMDLPGVRDEAAIVPGKWRNILAEPALEQLHPTLADKAHPRGK
jgi:hypothetical protein